MVKVHKQAQKIEGHTRQPERISLVSTGFIILVLYGRGIENFLLKNNRAFPSGQNK